MILPKLKETINKLINANVLSKIEEPTDLVSPLVIVEKKDKTLRLRLDPKELNQYMNEIIKPFQHPRIYRASYMVRTFSQL